MAEENTADTNVIQFPEANPNWAADIKEHARLIMAYRDTVQLQKVVGQSLKACQDSAGNAEACLQTLPAKAKARIALRGAIKTAFGQKEPAAHEKLRQEQICLDRLQKLQLAALERLEARVLSAHPNTLSEPQRLLRFVAAISSLKRKGKQGAQTEANKASAVKAKPAVAVDQPSVPVADYATS